MGRRGSQWPARWVDGGKCSQQGAPALTAWASDGPPPTPTPSAGPAPLIGKHRTEDAGGERERQKEGEREAPSVRHGLSADPARARPPPPPSWHSWEEEGGGAAGAVGPHTQLPTLGPRPPQPPLPALGVGVGGSQARITDAQGVGRPFPRRGGTKGGPTGRIKRCQAGGQRTGRAAAASGTAGQPDGRLDARPSALCPSRAAPLWAVLRPGGRC